MKFLLSSLALLAPLTSVHAATITVTRTDDPVPDTCKPRDCSLREAVIAANATVAHDTIVLGAQTYVLTRGTDQPGTHFGIIGPLRVSSPVTFVGVDPASTRVRWDTSLPWRHSVLEFAGSEVGGIELTLSQLTVSHGRGNSGGCIWAGSRTDLPRNRVVIERSVIEECEGFYGAAAKLLFTNVALRGAIIRGNKALHDGGAFSFVGSADIESAGAEISGNEAGFGGGAIELNGESMYGIFTKVVWVDDGTSVVRNNAAGHVGGAVALYNASTIDISTVEGTPKGHLLSFSENHSDGSGGAFWLRTQAMNDPSDSNRLQRIRVVDNYAAIDGGGLQVSGKLHASDMEIARNQAGAGNGGGVALTGSEAYARVFERVSLHGNRAALGGGALSASCQGVEMRDTAIFGNRAADQRGQAIETSGNATLRHVTVSGQRLAPALRKTHDSFCGATAMRYTNSLLVDSCSTTVSSQLASDGGNQFGPSAWACPSLASTDRRQTDAGIFRLSIGRFGGDFDVTGWTAGFQSPPQRNFGLTARCSASDARDSARDDGRCDSGAFEQ